MSHWTLRSVAAFLIGGALTSPSAAQQAQTFVAGTEERGSTGVFFWNMVPQPFASKAGHLVIHHGLPPWNPMYEKQFAQLMGGNRWRLGQNFWTTLDASLRFQLGEQEIAAGYYYLALEKNPDLTWDLVLLDPLDVQDAQLGEAQVGRRPLAEVARAALEFEQTDPVVPRLEIEFQAKGTGARSGRLEIRFGVFRLHTTFHVEL